MRHIYTYRCEYREPIPYVVNFSVSAGSVRTALGPVAAGAFTDTTSLWNLLHTVR